MKIDVNVKSICSIDIDSTEAFRMLCKTLDMEFVYNSDIDFFVREDSLGENCVYFIKDGHDELYDERGDLFVALRNVAVNIFPNLDFRGAHYIYK
jgi:hypothetical protein